MGNDSDDFSTCSLLTLRGQLSPMVPSFLKRGVLNRTLGRKDRCFKQGLQPCHPLPNIRILGQPSLLDSLVFLLHAWLASSGNWGFMSYAQGQDWDQGWVGHDSCLAVPSAGNLGSSGSLRRAT